MDRYLKSLVISDAFCEKKLAFVTGPRQSGKTTLAKSILEAGNQAKNYFNWDDFEFQKNWLRNPKDILNQVTTPQGQDIWIVLDELHKFRKWKTSLKGVYDIYSEKLRLLVTGSARLDTYRKTGDSLAGRYRLYHLHPFTYCENSKPNSPPHEDSWLAHARKPTFDLSSLLELGGFPEPLLGGSKEKADRWWRLYRDQIVREDLRDIKAYKEINLIAAAANLLVEKAAGTLSIKSLQEDLKVSFATANDWVEALKAVFYGFSIRPYSKKIKNSLQKAPKFYLYHYPAVQNLGARLENLVACHLLKACHFWTDAALGEFELTYIRDKQKREVDFFVLKDSKPWLLLEVKSSPQPPTEALLYYAKQLKPKFVIQLGQEKGQDKNYFYDQIQIELLNVESFLGALI